VLHSFTGGSDGANPNAGLILGGIGTAGAAGNIFGTTSAGGNLNGACSNGGFVPGCGVVFDLGTSSPLFLLQRFKRRR
jgi:hypothetical protein